MLVLFRKYLTLGHIPFLGNPTCKGWLTGNTDSSPSHQLEKTLQGHPSSRAALPMSLLSLHASPSSPLLSPASSLSCPQVSTSRTCFLHTDLCLRACFLQSPSWSSQWRQMLRRNFAAESSSACLAMRTYHWHRVEVKLLQLPPVANWEVIWWKGGHKRMRLIRHLRNMGQIIMTDSGIGWLYLRLLIVWKRYRKTKRI